MKGHVRKRGSKWCFVVDVGKDANGKRIRKWVSGFDTKKEAEKAMTAKLQEIHSGLYVEPAKETMESYMTTWLADKASQVRPSTYRGYAWLINRHIIPGLGRIKISDLRPQHLQTFYRNLQKQEKPLSNRSILHTHMILHEALDRALKWGLIARNVADAVDPPRPETKQNRIWTPEDVRRFLEANEKEDPRFFAGFVLGIMVGMRKGEILGLRWSDIDWKQSVAHINQSLTWVNGGPRFLEPKTDRSRRAVALSPETIEVLKKHRSHQAPERLLYGQAYQEYDLVLCRVDGRPVHPRTFDAAWYRALDRADVPRIRFHDLRHTHASLLLAQGVHPKIVSERLGHSTINVTLDIYSHVLPGLQKEVANQFDDVIFRRNSGEK